MDGSSNEGGSRGGLILVSLHRMHCALRFGFKASNNEAKYEVLIAGLNLTREMKLDSLKMRLDYSNLRQHDIYYTMDNFKE